jgi:anti-anti-sigma factor
MAFGHAVHRGVTIGEQHGDAMSVPADFRVHVARERWGVRVSPVGEVDLGTVGHLRERMYEAIGSAGGLVILDLRGATFFDSTGLRLAIEFDAQAAGTGTEFAIIAGPPAVQRTFDIAGLSALLPFVEVPRG